MRESTRIKGADIVQGSAGVLIGAPTGVACSVCPGGKTSGNPVNLPPVEWLTYGSGYLVGMKLGDTPLVEFTRDRLHRETLRRFGSGAGTYEQTTTFTAAGQLQSQYTSLPQFNLDYGWDAAGRLGRISGMHRTREYGYSGSGRLTDIILTEGDVRVEIPYETDAAGNRVEEKALREARGLAERFPDNRITEDLQYLYRYDESGSLTEKRTNIPVGAIRSGNEKTHHYRYDSQHRLVHYRLTHGFSNRDITESRYIYDATGRRVCRMVWQCKRRATNTLYEEYGDMPRQPETTWYGWDGDRLTTTQTQAARIQTVYQPGSFTPLLRIETETAALAKCIAGAWRKDFSRIRDNLPGTAGGATERAGGGAETREGQRTEPAVAGAVRTDSGATGGPGGAGVHAGA